MVFLSKLLCGNKKVIRKYLQNGFTDSLRVYVRGGTGGNGLPKFGGIGGQGGNIIFVGTESISLDDVARTNKKKHFIAGSGVCSSHNFILGPPGNSVKVDVPVGVTVFTDEGKKLGEINSEGDEIVVAKGGPGGHPKNGFLGVKGQCYPVRLDLKLIADIGLVGFPNAGKSTLLKAISQAKPKIASYPFTTIKPNIGMISYKDLRQISVADLPGLIEGAHVNKGLGHTFLKHVERTQMLLIMADINGFQLSPQYPHRSCLDTIVLLNKELELYNPELLKKPKLMVINKMDSILAFKRFFEIRQQILNLGDIFYEYPDEMKPEKPLIFDDILAISAKESLNDIDLVKNKIRQLLDNYAEVKKEQERDEFEHLSAVKQTLIERGPKLV
ncbi:hypothetical protein FQA39_LY12039 [Lamprigera yunnana]|nr:hypothetical protein FQA39_LY12039 [Lamprigera yunnana]